MTRDFDVEQARSAAREAFAPYEKNVRLIEDGSTYRLQVMDNQRRATVDITDISPADTQDADRFYGILSNARDLLEARGFSLQPWEPPRTG